MDWMEEAHRSFHGTGIYRRKKLPIPGHGPADIYLRMFIATDINSYHAFFAGINGYRSFFSGNDCWHMARSV